MTSLQMAINRSDVISNIVLFGRIIYAILCIDKKVEDYGLFSGLKNDRVLDASKLKCEFYCL